MQIPRDGITIRDEVNRVYAWYPSPAALESFCRQQIAAASDASPRAATTAADPSRAVQPRAHRRRNRQPQGQQTQQAAQPQAQAAGETQQGQRRRGRQPKAQAVAGATS